MIQVSKIQEGLFGLVGIRQPLDPSLPILNDANKESRSGLFVDDVPPFRLKLLKDTQEYISITDNELNDYIANMQKTSITNLMFRVFDQGDFIDRNYLFSRASSRKKVISEITDGSVFGYKIEVGKRKNLGFKISRVRLEFDFDNPTEDVILYLFNSFLEAPIQTKEITLDKKDFIQELNWFVDSTQNDYKGNYYLLIKSVNGNRLQPFERDYEDSNKQNNIAFLDFDRVLIPNFSATIFDFDNEIELTENVGINPDVIVYDDFTDFVLTSQHLFSRAIQLEFAVNLMQQIATSTRSNPDERKAREIVAMMEIKMNGSEGQGKGLRGQIYYEVQSLKKEVQKLKKSFFQGMISVSTDE
ncbi:MAG: hypothetical protein FGM14_14090 [Flavobacteriales bacterium]|nr:hypothetical protein [Flavobacteriales bacterium]